MPDYAFKFKPASDYTAAIEAAKLDPPAPDVSSLDPAVAASLKDAAKCLGDALSLAASDPAEVSVAIGATWAVVRVAVAKAAPVDVKAK